MRQLTLKEEKLDMLERLKDKLQNTSLKKRNFWKIHNIFKKFRHSVTNYDDLTPEYNRNKRYLNLVLQVVELTETHLPKLKGHKVVKSWVDEKVKRNS